MSDVESSRIDTLIKVVSIVGGLVCAFIAGAYTTEFEVFPYPQLLERPFQALRARRERQQLTEKNPRRSAQWQGVSADWQTGVTTHRPEETAEGYTLFTSAHASAAFLVDQQGAVVHEWSKAFRDVYGESSHVSDPVPSYKISWADAHVFPNGDVLGAYAADGDTPYGYGLVKLDEDSNVLWKWEGHVHHDFDVRPDGTIWLLDQSFRDTSEEPIPHVPDGWVDRVLEGFVVKLSPEGDELERIPLLDAWAEHYEDEFVEQFRGKHQWDPLHVNDIEYIDEDFAEHHYFVEPGQLMLSARAFDSLAVIEPETGELVWTKRGFWKSQHDPDAMGDGEVWLFDNQGYRGPGGSSQIVKFDPQTLRVSRSFHGTEKRRFHCTWWGKQTPLENGNVLIADSLNGRLLEVNPSNDIVWEWHTPSVVEYEGKRYVPNLKAPVERISASELEFTPDRPSPEESLLFVESDRSAE